MLMLSMLMLNSEIVMPQAFTDGAQLLTSNPHGLKDMNTHKGSKVELQPLPWLGSGSSTLLLGTFTPLE